MKFPVQSCYPQPVESRGGTFFGIRGRLFRSIGHGDVFASGLTAFSQGHLFTEPQKRDTEVLNLTTP